MEHIRHYVLIEASVAKVYEAITSEQGLQDWWTSETIAKPEKGYQIQFKFGGIHEKKMEIIELRKNEFVSWKVVASEPEWLGTDITFSLEERDGKTALRFAHRNWKDATEYYENCNFHWGYFLQSLRLLCQTGKGTPV